jgi:beta-aspartyl-peptidase (threonine type)
MPITIIVHGGAGTLTPDRVEITQAGCKEAALQGWRILQEGGSALDAVEVAVRALEDNPQFNAGTGSCLTSEGNIEMDAGLMEGHTLRVGSVAAVELIKNPVSLARKVMESPHVLLVGKGAQRFALEQGFSLCKYEDLLTERQYRRWRELREKHAGQGEMHGEEGEDNQEEESRYYRREVSFLPARESHSHHIHANGEAEERHGTVGAVAIDSAGNLASATSTGGIFDQYPGRVGDSPLVGCGFYADEHAAISCTGSGEDFMRLLIAKRAADFVAHGANARAAAEAAIAYLGAKATGTGGLIIVDRLGNVGFAWNSQNMVHAYMSEGLQEPATGV